MPLIAKFSNLSIVEGRKCSSFPSAKTTVFFIPKQKYVSFQNCFYANAIDPVRSCGSIKTFTLFFFNIFLKLEFFSSELVTNLNQFIPTTFWV